MLSTNRQAVQALDLNHGTAFSRYEKIPLERLTIDRCYLAAHAITTYRSRYEAKGYRILLDDMHHYASEHRGNIETLENDNNDHSDHGHRP